LKAAGSGDEDSGGTAMNKDYRVGGIQAGDVASERSRGVHQVPVVLELEHGLNVWYNIHFTKQGGPFKILNI
jgi:hypothetical protein